MLTSGNTLGCCSPGFTNSSNDNARPTADLTLPFGGGDTCVVDVVCESVVLCVGAVSVGVASEFGTESGVCTVTGEDWIVGADVLEAGLKGLIGDIGLVGLLIDFLQVSLVVIHEAHTGLP